MGLLCIVVVAGCGGGASDGSTSSPTAGSTVDPCLVNTWVSISVSGEVQGQVAQISGGTGEKVTIGGDGSIQIDDSDVAPLHVTAQGKSAQVKQSGRGSGKVISSGGNRVQVTLDSSDLAQQVFDATGANAQGTPQAVPTAVTLSYTCSANRQLQLSQSPSSGGSQTVTYRPASRNG